MIIPELAVFTKYVRLFADYTVSLKPMIMFVNKSKTINISMILC